MLNIRLWLIVLVLTVVSRLLLGLLGKHINIGWIFLFWVVAILGTTGLLYLISMLG
jgi:hypothetical protein